VVTARLDRQVPSQAGRRDVVQVRVTLSAGGAVATPLFGASALLSVLTSADGWLAVDEDATGLAAGATVDVTLYR
jgi:molybdopterin molybdotransferase